MPVCATIHRPFIGLSRYNQIEYVGGGDIPDPYGLDQNAYDVTAFRLKLASQNLLNIISEKR